MTTRLSVVVVAGLVLTAGCSAIPLGNDAGGRPTSTLTPVPITDATTAPTTTPNPSAPAWLHPDGTLNATALRIAHERFVDNRTYRWRLTYATTSEQDRLYDRDFSRRAVVGRDGFLVTQESPGPGANQSLYVTGGKGYLRSGTGNETRYDLLTDPDSHYEYAFAGTTIERFLAGLTFGVRVVERDGESLYRLHAAGTDSPDAVRATATSVWNYTATAYVTPAGFVRALVVDYDRTQGSRTQHVTVRFDYRDVDATTVFRPTWVSNVTTSQPTPGSGTATPGTETPTAGPGTATPTSTPGPGTESGTPAPPTPTSTLNTTGAAAADTATTATGHGQVRSGPIHRPAVAANGETAPSLVEPTRVGARRAEYVDGE